MGTDKILFRPVPMPSNGAGVLLPLEVVPGLGTGTNLNGALSRYCLQE